MCWLCLSEEMTCPGLYPSILAAVAARRHTRSVTWVTVPRSRFLAASKLTPIVAYLSRGAFQVVKK
jgi:hypothetical protein